MCAVSFLNTVPLVWGMLRGEERGAVGLSFSVPSECSDRIAEGAADAGLVPVVEVQRQRLDVIGDFGIACHGAVRSILLVSKVPPARIRTLAADSNSRTTVMLARILLAEVHGAEPEFYAMKPELATMLGSCDAALLIGDSALHVDPAVLPFETLDLGAVWNAWTGLPMVFAVWAGHASRLKIDLAAIFERSYRFGAASIDEIVESEAPARGIDPEMAKRYLTGNIVFELGRRDRLGMESYLKLARHYEGRRAKARMETA